ncbi:MAG: hypothetical protein ABIP55_04685, partial [Tepidisphaeraceae bacterium]
MTRQSILSNGGVFSCAVATLAAIAMLPPTLQAATVLPDFSQATFTPGASIDNPYFPLVPGTTLHYSATVIDPEDPASSEFVEIEDTVTFTTETVNGIQTRVRRAREW